MWGGFVLTCGLQAEEFKVPEEVVMQSEELQVQLWESQTSWKEEISVQFVCCNQTS